MKDIDLDITNTLRKHNRIKIKDIAKKLNKPISTIFERIKRLEKGIIKHHTCIIDFEKCGFGTKVIVLISLNLKTKKEFYSWISKNPSINLCLRLSGTYDTLAEIVCKNFFELEEILDEIKSRFSPKKFQILLEVEDICRESFLPAAKKQYCNPVDC